MKLVDFFLNAKDKEKQDVEAPAFSITKVLSTTAIVVAPLATIIVDKATQINLSEGQYVTLAIGLLAFLAVIASVDMVARAYAAAHKIVEPTRLRAFKTSLEGHHGAREVKVLGTVEGEKTLLLVYENGGLKIVPESKVTVP